MLLQIKVAMDLIITIIIINIIITTEVIKNNLVKNFKEDKNGK